MFVVLFIAVVSLIVAVIILTAFDKVRDDVRTVVKGNSGKNHVVVKHGRTTYHTTGSDVYTHGPRVWHIK